MTPSLAAYQASLTVMAKLLLLDSYPVECTFTTLIFSEAPNIGILNAKKSCLKCQKVSFKLPIFWHF